MLNATLSRDIKELVEYSDSFHDKQNIKTISDEHGIKPSIIKNEVVDILVFRLNRLARTDRDFYVIRDRLHIITGHWYA